MVPEATGAAAEPPPPVPTSLSLLVLERGEDIDYRSAYREVGERFGIEFQYADEQITNQHVLVKIEDTMDDADSACSTSPTGTRTSPLNLGSPSARTWPTTSSGTQPPSMSSRQPTSAVLTASSIGTTPS
jgi:hypothetical protein